MGASQAQVLMFAHAHVEAKRFPARSHHKHQVKSADLTRYPEDIAQALLNIREVPLAGPGLARTQFRDGCVQHRAAVAEVVVDSVAADHPTDAQLLAIARQYFSISRSSTTWSRILRPPPERLEGKSPAAMLCEMRSLFHLAFHVTDLDAARRFYGGVLGCQEGRSTDTWVDFDFFGHQISLHLGAPFASARTGHVGDHMVPMPHFGAILELPDWHALAARLQAADTPFVLAPQVRFEGQPGEQWTMFFHDPSGNPIEIKGFRSLDQVYAA